MTNEAELLKLIGTVDYQTAPFAIQIDADIADPTRYTVWKLVPNVDWNVVLTERGVGAAQQFIVMETTAIRDGAKLLDSEPLDAWQAYVTVHFINSFLTEPHSPRIARGSFPPRNMDAWYAAFNVQPGDKLYLKPEERVRIW